MALNEDQAAHALTVLVRLARREQDTVPWILRAVQADPARMIGPAIRVAIETGEPMGTVVRTVLETSELPTDVLLAAYDLIPAYTVVLRAVATVLAQKLLTRPESELPGELRATLLADHAERLLEEGAAEPALTAAHEAVTAAIGQLPNNPQTWIHARRILAACQVGAGDATGAVATAETTLAVLALAGIDEPLTIAQARYSLGLRLAQVGNLVMALSHVEFAVDIYERAIITLKESADSRAGTNHVGSLYRTMAIASLQAADLRQKLKQPSFARAWRATTILRELAEEHPDAYRSLYAQALLCTTFGIREIDTPTDDSTQARLLVEANSTWMLDQLILAAAQSRDLETLAARVDGFVALSRSAGPAGEVELLDHLVSRGLNMLVDNKLTEARIVLAAAAAAARPLAPQSAEGGSLLVRALHALGRLQSHDVNDPSPDETSVAAATSVDTAAAAVASAVGGTAYHRAVASSGLSLRLRASGQVIQAWQASTDAVRALLEVYDATRPDLVYFAAMETHRLFSLADEAGTLAHVDEDILDATLDFVTHFEGHRAGTVVVEWLALACFGALSGYSAHHNTAGVARAHRAAISLAQSHPDVAVAVRSRTLAALNAINAHVRALDLDLADEAFADICKIAQAHPDDDEATVQQARCATILINLYIDIDLTRAAAVVRAAYPALSSPAYLAVVDDDDPESFVDWLDQILAANNGDRPTPTAEQLAAAEADFVATLTGYAQRYGEDSPPTIGVRKKLAQVLWDEGKLAAADEQLALVVASLRRTVGDSHHDTVDALEARAQIRFELEGIHRAEVTE